MWGKVLFWVCGGGLALSGLFLARKLFRRGKRPVWVKRGSQIFKGKESKVTLVEVDAGDESPVVENETSKRRSRR
jgi:hypothetical protein